MTVFSGKRLLSLLLLLSATLLQAQDRKSYPAGEIAHRLEKVQVLGSALYLAAHPDDENTRLISWLANDRHYRTAYLSLTRGDGGQNLIGAEIRERLGLIRTQELLAARRIDGGEQFFTRANDFGYSKHPDETFRIWNQDSILYDVVYVIRKFRPDVIITRFNTLPGVTHGHHTASAMLAKEAFKLAGDPKVFPEQLRELEVWQPQRLYWNTSPWFFANSGQQFDSTQYLAVNVGGYNPLLGQSYNEIAAEARSMHRSQGFGTSRQRGNTIEYLEPWEGKENPKTIFEGIPTDWSRLKGGRKVGALLQKAAREFDSHKPEAIVPSLITAYRSLQAIPENPFKKQKLEELKELILAASGIFLDVYTQTGMVAQGEPLALEAEFINRSSLPVTLKQAKIQGFETLLTEEQALPTNEAIRASTTFSQTSALPISQPYWLQNSGTLGHFHFPDSLTGKAENPAALTAEVRLSIAGETFTYQVPVRYKQVSPDFGEAYQPLFIIPRVMVNLPSDLLLFHEEKAKQLQVSVVAGADSVAGRLRLSIEGEGWQVQEAEREFSLGRKGESKHFTFTVSPPAATHSTTARATVRLEGKTFSRGMQQIRYAHLPDQVFFPRAEMKLVRVNMRSAAKNILYIPGAGDVLPDALRQVGFQVKEVAAEELTPDDLRWADAAVLGVRAFNTQPALAYKKQLLEKFARQGGVVLIQYNTNFRLVTEALAPYPLTLSRERVTEEDAAIRMLAPDHPALVFPNKISPADFDGWVQERGLYFPSSWDEAWVPLLSSNDQGEEALDGGLLVAKVGQGYYVYSGYSWFRQLPAGVPGAYRLLANLLSLSAANP